MAKEITELLQTGGAAGDSSIGLDSSLGLVRRDSVPYDKDAAAVDSAGDDLFVGVSVSGEARTFNAIPYIKGDTAATPAVDDLVVGIGNDGSAKQFTVASLATTLEGESFGTAAFVNTGTGAGEVPLTDDLGSAAYLDASKSNVSNTMSVAGLTTFGTASYTKNLGIITYFFGAAHIWADIDANSYTGTGRLILFDPGVGIQYEGIIPATYDEGSGAIFCYGHLTTSGYIEFFYPDGTDVIGASSFSLQICGTVRRQA